MNRALRGNVEDKVIMTLSEALPLQYGKSKSAEGGYKRPNSLVIGSSGPFGTLDRALTKGPTIVVGRKGSAGKVYYSTDPCWPTDTTYYTDDSANRCLKYWHYLLESLQLNKLDRSTAIPSLSRDDYNAISVSIPNSVELQKGIADQIDAELSLLNEGSLLLESAQQKLKTYRASVLKAACEGRLVPTEAELARQEGRDYETGPQLLTRILSDREKTRTKTVIPAASEETIVSLKLSDGWCLSSMQDLLVDGKSSMKTGPFGSLLKKHEHLSHGVPVLGIENIGPNSTFKVRSKVFVSKEKAKDLSSYDIVAGDVIVSRSGTVGELCVVPLGLGEARFSTNIMRIRLNPEVIDAKFFCSLFSGSPGVLSQVEQLCKGSTRLFLNQQILQSVHFPLPPLAEQIRIVAEVERRLSVIDQLEATVTANLQRAARLRQSILLNVFNGSVS